jgi:4-aminobutyrate aminotransferase-like enzyme
VLKEERLIERAGRLGEAAGKRLRQSLGNLRAVAELRGIGLWFGIELMDRLGRPAAEQAKAAARRLRERGIVVGRGGHEDNVVKLSPPLVIEAGVLMEAIDQVAEAIRETAD